MKKKKKNDEDNGRTWKKLCVASDEKM
jgi:hypothetical protein